MAQLRHGVHYPLEEIADEILRKEVAHLPRSEKEDLLTPWKLKDRLSREVYAGDGTVDPAIRRGMFHRVWNSEYPHLNSRDGHTRPARIKGNKDGEDSHGWHDGD